MSEQVENIPVELLIPPFVLLRLVDKTALDYMELRDSIAAHGLFASLLVRKSKRLPGKYEIINGLCRYCCALDCELKDVPCIIKEATDAEVKNWQVQANMIHCETATTEYAARLKMLFCDNPELTMEDIAAELHCRPAKLKDILRLNKLIPAAKDRLDTGDLSVTSAYALSKAPQRLQEDLLKSALSLSVREFMQVCNGYLKAYKEAANQGRYKKYLQMEVVATPYLRSFRNVKQEYANTVAGRLILEDLQLSDPIDIWKAALAWVLHIDHLSIQVAKEKAQQRAEIEQRRIEKRKMDRALNQEERTKAAKLGVSPDDVDMIEIVTY